MCVIVSIIYTNRDRDRQPSVSIPLSLSAHDKGAALNVDAESSTGDAFEI